MVDDALLTELQHIGVARRSGRYKWGSGKDPFQGSKSLLVRDAELRKEGKSEKEIADLFGMSIKRLREEKSIERERQNTVMKDSVDSMTKRGLTNEQMAESLGVSLRTISNIKNQVNKVDLKRTDNIKEAIKSQLEKSPYLDVSSGVEKQLGISKEKLRIVIRELKEEGNLVEHDVYLKRLKNPESELSLRANDDIHIRVLTPEKDLLKVVKNSSEIRNFESVIDDDGVGIRGMKPPVPVDVKRVAVRFEEDGGDLRDGLIELRRGVDDLDMGSARYAQVRIQVGDKNYLKGMAVYVDDLPDGVDIRFNTNKSKKVGEIGAMKKLEKDPNNPFGSTIRDQKGALNIVNSEGKWSEWNKKWASQFLGKQSKELIKDRLDNTYEKFKNDFDEISALTNPTVRKFLMQDYANTLSSAYKHLKVQGLSGTASHVILPFPDMNPNQVYAPNHNDGDRVVLLRYPHGGTFELAELTVNNKYKPAKDMIGTDAKDAIGIHPSVAQKMSGADFDGDAVWVIPNNNKKVTVTPALNDLKNFDGIKKYRVEPKYDSKGEITNQTIAEKTKNTQMGIVSNLITDMTIQGATTSELARAIKHSMVVIDSYKHNLDYKQSAIDNNIKALQKDYMTYIDANGKKRRGAATLLSKKLGGNVLVDYEEVKVFNEETKRYNTKKVGGKIMPLIDTVDDANLLSSGTAVEKLYAGYINNVKNLQRVAEDVATKTKGAPYVPGMKALYRPEVESLERKLHIEYLRAPRERQALLEANKNFYNSLRPGMTLEQQKKLRSQVIATARQKHNPRNTEPFKITPKEWEAINSGAIHHGTLMDILKFGDSDQIKKYASPKELPAIKAPSLERAKALLNNGYTYAEVAKELGVSSSTVHDLVN